MPPHSTATQPKAIDVVCLVAIDNKDQILVTQRAEDKPLPLLWEFPGGKVDQGESAEIALRREIIEELGLDLDALTRLPSVTHHYTFGTIRLIPFITLLKTRPDLSQLNAHAAARWIALHDWDQLQWAPADVPIIERLLQTEIST